MLTKLIITVAKMVYGKQILEIIDGLHERVVGHRSEILIALIAAIGAAQHLGLIDQKVSESIITALLGALPVTLAVKIGNALKEADAVLPTPSAPPTA